MDPLLHQISTDGDRLASETAFAGDSEMGEVLRAFDWSATTLGPIGGWPQTLKVAVGICLNSRFPMFVWWGPQFINIYNDAYIPILGKRHPTAFGRPARQVWEEIWPTVGPQAEAVMQRGEATWNERVLLVMERNDYREDAWFTWSYSPIPDHAGGIGGVFCACREETGQVYADADGGRLLERLATERSRLVEAFAQSPAFVAVLRGPDHVFEFANERYRQLVGHREILDRPAREALPEVEGQGLFELLDEVYASGEPYVGSGTRLLIQQDAGELLSERYVDFVYQPMRDAEDAVRGILVHGVDVTERKRTEDALRDSEERLRFSLDAGRIGSWHLDLTTGVSWRSLEHDRIFGYEQLLPDWTYEMFLEHVLPEERAHVDGIFRSTLEGRNVWDIECRIRRADGAIRWIAPRGRVQRDGKGKPAHMYGIVVDITERKRIEEEIQERERRLSAIVEQSAAGIAQTDLTGRLLFANRRFCELVGYPLEEVLQMRVHDLTHPDDLQQTSELVGQAATVGQEYAIEKRYIRGDGSTIWVSVSAGILKDETGRPYSIMGVVIDISGRKQAEEALREQEMRHAASLLAAMDCVISMDHEGNVIEWNPAAEQTFGYSRDEAVGRKLGQLIIPQGSRERHDEGLERYLRTGQDRVIGRRIELTATRRDGGEFPVELAITRLPTSGPPIFTAYLRDISERRAAEDALRRAKEEAERASEAKSEFLATLSHELRTPLTPVLLTVSLMESHPALPDALRDDVAMIRRNVELESRLISDLLDLTRIARGKLQLDLQAVDLHLVIRSAIDICQREASARLVVDLAAERHNVHGDGTRLQQVFWNLINNAIKFTGPDGSITVRSRDAGKNMIRVEVTDTGMGIDPSVVPRLFTAFEQGEVRAGRQQAGLGLGLAISRRLVEMHGGTISARSQGHGQGSTFTVELPTVEFSKEPEKGVCSPVHQPGTADPLAVLLVEDHEPTLTVMTKLLRRIGHRVTQATSVASARAAASQETFDLIISDLGLPDGSGLDVMRHLSSEFAGRAIALTGYGTESDIAASRKAGFAEHLIKPVDLAALEEVISRVTQPRQD